jgi:hypothetical protein
MNTKANSVAAPINPPLLHVVKQILKVGETP